jgi:hypothetical protein
MASRTFGSKAEVAAGETTSANLESGHSITAHYANHDLPGTLRPYFFIRSLKTQCSYRLGDLSRIFFVGRSAPAGMTDRNMLDVMPRAFTCSNIPQCDHFPSLKLKASYLVERTPDCGL